MGDISLLNYVILTRFMKRVYFKDLGVVDYDTAWQLQEDVLKKGLAIKSKKFKDEPLTAEDIIHNYLFFCEHPHVYTLGKSGHMENLLVNDARLKELNVSFYKTNRGGDITYHGPGQIVGYPVLDLEQFFTDLGKYMRFLEEVVIKAISTFGITAGRLEGSTGVWLDPENPQKARKICAMGVRCSRWITMHGFALNVNTDLSFFGHIVPCGITDKAVTSMQKELGAAVGEELVKEELKKAFCDVFNAEILPAKDGLYAINT